MSILQPTLTTISPDDFRDNTYCFTVESVVTQKEFTGMLTVNTSAGYLLTTSHTNDLRREQTLDHVQQTDGNWIAKGTVNLIASGNELVNGTVVIRNSLTESVVLTIEATSVSLVQQKSFGLATLQPTLTFASTSPNKASFLIVTIDPQSTDIPLKLTTDAPEYFQLASDSRPIFLPDLNLAPSSTGTSVHIRYSTKRPGTHRGQLIIQGAQEKQTVLLEGRTTRLLPTLKPRTLRYSAQHKMLARKSILFLALVIMGGLTYVGYMNRCQFFPTLCRDEAVSQINTQPVTSTELTAISREKMDRKAANAPTLNRENQAKNTALVHRINTRVVQENSPVESIKKNALTEESTTVTKARSAVYTPETRQKLKSQNIDNQIEGKSPGRRAPTAEEESELEKVLNQEL